MRLLDLFESAIGEGNRALLDYFQWKLLPMHVFDEVSEIWDEWCAARGADDLDYSIADMQTVRAFSDYLWDYGPGMGLIPCLRAEQPQSVPAWMWMQPEPEALLPASTWVLHFTDHAHSIVQNGFTHGVHPSDMDSMAFTYRFSDERAPHTGPGYNFGYRIADGGLEFRADNMPENGYGNQAVVFRSSGIRYRHAGDREIQVVFYGPEVDRRSMFAVKRTPQGWTNGQTTRPKLDELLMGI